ncbi:MAG: magnesium transporter [Chloroflexota bacterium]|nr:magnesium transporter [Chloroflexota bacterium]
MTNPTFDHLLAILRTALEREDYNAAVELLHSHRPQDRANAISELEIKEQVALLSKLDETISADIIEDLDDTEAAVLIVRLPTATAIRIVDEMEPDEAADLLGDLHPEAAQVILSQLKDREEIQPLLIYPDETAGGLMTSEFLAFHPQMTTRQALKMLRTWKPETEAVYYLFVADEQNRLSGVVNLRQLVVAEIHTLISEIMNPDVISVQAGTDQEVCSNLMAHYDLLALPVVDKDKVLLGIITIDDIVDVLIDEATEDIHRLGGAQPLGQRYFKASVFSVARKRIGWLLLLLIAGSLTVTVLRHFEEKLQAVVALSFFVPLLIGAGGNAGTQTTTTIIRSLATGEIDSKDMLRALWHEVRTGVLLGLVMSVAAYVITLTWESSTALSFTVSIAVFLIVVWATMLGSLLPILAYRFRIDPAVASGPLLSTLVDATGLFIYFTVAVWLLGL